MCFTIAYRRNGAPAPAVNQALAPSLCLLGEHCAAIGHTRTIYQDGSVECCQVCAEHMMNISQWSHNVGGEHVEVFASGGNTRAAIVDKQAVTKTAEEELHTVLEKVKRQSEFFSLLHYILSLRDDKVDKGRLLEIFGANLGCRTSVEDRRKLQQLAKAHMGEHDLVFFLNSIRIVDPE
ncbi:hypothetical protein F5Y17DRAFT_83793 [Xylariaceae sp. FL0594]|nr:hypothetical protein F5Y17DRAFT_83793 [Xylariaceae sp. FL0594]